MADHSIFEHFSEPGIRSFISYGEYYEGAPKDVPLSSLLGIKTQDLKQFTKALFETDESTEGLQDLLSELSRGISALFQFQDILDISLDENGSPLVSRHYCYYESLIYLRESVVSWLDKNVLAALTLLRPFLELSVLYLYWHLRCRLSSYKPYYDWLTLYGSDRGKPSFKAALDYVLENLPTKECVKEHRLKEVKEVIRNIYKTLCSYHHAPKMDESVAAASGGMGSISLDTFLYYVHITNILLHQVVYLYILTYPMSLFPVDRYKKWGFKGGPVGLFFDETNYGRIEAYVGLKNCETLKLALKNYPDVISLSDWFNDFPNLSQEELDSDWAKIVEQTPSLSEIKTKDPRQRLAAMKAFRRSESWALNYVLERPQDKNIPDDLSERLRKRIRDW